MKLLFNYLKPYKKLIYQLIIGLLFCSLASVAFPFLTQSVIDIGVVQRNIGFVYLVLIVQLVLLASQISVEFIRSWIFLHMGTQVNITLISDFLKKLMSLNLPYFENKTLGDLLQRIMDHTRIQNFLTISSLNFLFSILTFILFSIVLIVYSFNIFLVFFIGSIASIIWILIFFKKRRDLDFNRFRLLSENQNHVVQLISGIQDIKINNCYISKRKGWEEVQSKIYTNNIRGLTIGQMQQGGSAFFSNIKTILVTMLAAIEVINGNLTIGMMLAIAYVLGQLNAPIEQLLSFIQNAQDAKLSLNRISEIHTQTPEVDEEVEIYETLPENTDIIIDGVSYSYTNKNERVILNNVNFIIPQGKTTAIVGQSGCGKTTLIKLLLKFYKTTKGEILIGNHNLDLFRTELWRNQCGVVLQDGYIFEGTIESNIALSNSNFNSERLRIALEIASLDDLMKQLPNGKKTKIGVNGLGLSQGQKQRILIARAVYKSPQFLILDEATSSLDPINEIKVLNNIKDHFIGKTIIIIAHKKSTLQFADQIISLNNGIVERKESKFIANNIKQNVFVKA